MGFLKVLASFLSDAGNELVHSDNMWKYEPDKRDIQISKNCREHMLHENISEKLVMDVFYNGYMRSKGKMVKKYSNYEAGILYMITPDYGKVIITWAWKDQIR